LPAKAWARHIVVNLPESLGTGASPAESRDRDVGERNAMEDVKLAKAAIFDLDGTLLDSVDLHAIAWHEAMLEFGHDVSFAQARGQIGKGGDQLIPVF
jgi:hypothetical protein